MNFFSAVIFFKFGHENHVAGSGSALKPMRIRSSDHKISVCAITKLKLAMQTRRSVKKLFFSTSVPDPDSFRSVDPDPGGQK